MIAARGLLRLATRKMQGIEATIEMHRFGNRYLVSDAKKVVRYEIVEDGLLVQR